MKKTVETVLERYGSELLLGTGERPVRGFFQSVHALSLHSLQAEVSPLGESSRELFTYIGPVSSQAKEGETLRLDGRTFRFRRVETYYYRGQPLYQWGLCVEKEDNDTW